MDSSFLRKTALWIVLIPVTFGFTGAALNQLVLIANHDKFPVMLNAAKLKEFEDSTGLVVTSEDEVMLDDVHEVMTPKTHLNFLADVFDFESATYSIGDLLLEFGAWLWSYSLLCWFFVAVKRLMELEE